MSYFWAGAAPNGAIVWFRTPSNRQMHPSLPPPDRPLYEPDQPDFALLADWAAHCHSRPNMLRLISHLQPHLGFEGWQISWVLSDSQGHKELLKVAQLPQTWSRRQRNLDFFSLDDELTKQLARPKAWEVQVWQNRSFAEGRLLALKSTVKGEPAVKLLTDQELKSLRQGYSCGLMGALQQAMLFWVYGSHLRLGKAAQRLLQQATPLLYVAAEQLWSVERKSYLTPRQRQVLEQQSAGLRKKDVAQDLSISPSTVSYHLTHACERLDAHNTKNAIFKATQLGLLMDSEP